MINKIVAIPFTRPEAITAVVARSGTIKAAYKADNTPICVDCRYYHINQE